MSLLWSTEPELSKDEPEEIVEKEGVLGSAMFVE